MEDTHASHMPPALHLLPSQHPTLDGHASTAADTDMSLWFTLGFSIGVLHCGCSQCIMVSVHHYNAMQDNFTARTILCVLPVHPSLFSPSWQPLIDISTVPTVLSFPECHSRGHSVCSLSDGPLSLGSMLRRGRYCFSWVDAHSFGHK